jgi:hypothetical protein
MNWSGFWAQEKSLCLAMTQTLIPQLSNLQPTVILTKLSQLPDKKNKIMEKI